MSRPLTRRIAQAALLVAAAATPLAAAGAASAADLLPKTDLGAGLSQLDNPNNTLQGATHDAGVAAADTTAATVQTGVPASADVAGKAVAGALPDADQALGKVAGPAAKTTETAGTLAAVAGKATPMLVDRLAPAVTDKVPHLPGSPAATRSLPGTGLPLSDLTSGSLTGTAASALPTGGVPDLGMVTDRLPGGLGHMLPDTGKLPVDTQDPTDHSNRLGGAPGLGDATGALGPVSGLLGGGLPLLGG
ncbi:hypothetical protein [Kitasatospora sp. NPDC004289]